MNFKVVILAPASVTVGLVELIIGGILFLQKTYTFQLTRGKRPPEV